MHQKYHCDFPLLIPKSAIRSRLQTTVLESTGPHSNLHLALADISLHALPAATPPVSPLLGYGPCPYLLNKT